MAIVVKYADHQKEVEKGTTIGDFILSVDKKIGKSALAAILEGKTVDLSTPLEKDCGIDLVFPDSPQGLEMLRHSTAHIMAGAVQRLFPDVQVTIGPSIENGFYYDFDKESPFVPEDLQKIEKEMNKIIQENHPFIRKEVSVDEAIKIFSEKGENYKVEIINDLVRTEKAETVSLYESGDFTDLCRGPHIPSTSKVKAFKLLDIAGAYWRGDEHNKMLQRIYGTAFADKDTMKEYLHNLEEAKKRDHRKLGKELDLFSFQEDGGPGLAYWHPKGGFIRHLMETFWKEEHFKRGYDLLYTPHIARAHLWETSGHLNFYRENMYSALDIDGQQYILKPMNCPFHILIYKTKKRSYRELPLRWAEMGTVYRYERSGVLHGLLRVRGFTQDDAHIFCTPDQLKSEMIQCVQFAIFIIQSMGFKEFDIFLATRPKEFAGTSQEWDQAEGTLKTALEEQGLPFVVDEGGAVFYGPKIDIKLKDALGRHWQGPTIQFDFNLARRFGVNYIGADGEEHQCFMVHRALFGSMERFFGCLVEHYAGAFPVWLSPVQAIILPISDRHTQFAQKLADEIKEAGLNSNLHTLANLGFRVEVDDRREKIGFKIREAQVQKIPYMIVIGDEEMEKGEIAVRERKQGDLGKMSVSAFIQILKERVKNKD